MSIICATGFGLEVNEILRNFNDFIELGNKIFRPSWRLFLDIMSPGILKRLNLSLFRHDVQKFSYDLVDQVIKGREGRPRIRHDFMDMLIEMKEYSLTSANRIKNKNEGKFKVTNDVIVAQAFMFFAAGFESAAMSMAFMFYELAYNQDIQDKVIEEIDRVFRRYKGNITFEALNDFKYSEMACLEAIRLYPIGDPLQRKCVADYSIPGTDLVIPKGTMVYVPTSGIHRDPEIWPNPDKFDPDRFLPENKGKRHPLAYLPFGAGPRGCLGSRFARLEIVAAMVQFFRRYRVMPSDRTATDLEINGDRMVLGPKGGIYLSIKRR